MNRYQFVVPAVVCISLDGTSQADATRKLKSLIGGGEDFIRTEVHDGNNIRTNCIVEIAVGAKRRYNSYNSDFMVETLSDMTEDSWIGLLDVEEEEE